MILCAAIAVFSCAQHQADLAKPHHNGRNPEQSNVRIDPVVELALIVAALSPLGENDDNYSPIRREGPYYDQVTNRFGHLRSHAAVVDLGSDFNLPRLGVQRAFD
jgi:hypothetical protein